MRGNVTGVGKRVEDLFIAHPRTEFSVKRAADMIGAAPNTVGQHVLSLFEAGFLLRRMEGVARGRHYVYIKKEAVVPGRTPIQFKNVPEWVKAMIRPTDPEGMNPDGFFWTVTDSGVFEAWQRPEAPLSTYHPLAPKLPEGVSQNDVIDWYAFPSWVKGSYRSDAEMHRLKSFTWVRLGGPEEVYDAYTREGEYAGRWGCE